MNVEIDQKSGFCFGVVNAIKKAEETLREEKTLFCLGDIVHNDMEVKRLESIGLVTIDHEKYHTLSNCKVLLRAHGEPPSTYEYAKNNNIELIDATCPVVLKLQQRIKKAAHEMGKCGGQVVIFGKKGHAEVLGLNGQTNDTAVIAEDPDDLNGIDASKPSALFSQTTKSIEKFRLLAENIRKISSTDKIYVHDTICRQVSNRAPRMKEFSAQHDVIVFAGGKKSSNARLLFEVCQQYNSRSYFISSVEEIDQKWFADARTVGICGATSTPYWLMEQVRNYILNH